MTNNNGHHRNGTGNGIEPDAAIVSGHELLWDGLSPAVTQALAQPLDPAIVSQRRGRAGRTFSYIKGHTVIDEANIIFGYGGWGYELIGDVSLREIENVDLETGVVKLMRAYSAPVRVTVPGAPPRTDLGFHAVTEETADGHETAVKGAVTDGLKRALRSFGHRFGNGLYGDQVPVNVPPKPQRAPARAHGQTNDDRPNRSQPGDRGESQARMLRGRLFEIATEQGFDEDGVRAAVIERTGKGVDELTADELAPLVKAADNKLRQMKQAAA